MKRLAFVFVAALAMSATSFAENKVESQNWTISMNVGKLGRYLNLSGNQYEEVAAISEYFSEKMQSAAGSKEAKQGKRLREAVYGNFKLMKSTLNEEQYKKYIRLMNITLKHKGLDVYLNK